MYVITVPYFNLNQIYDSYQVPRWIKIEKDKYIIIHENKACMVIQTRDRFDYNRYRLCFICNNEDFYNVWFNYLDFATDYQYENTELKRINNRFRIASNVSCGIHKINQSELESYIYSNIVYMYGYKKAKSAINHIAQICGTKHKNTFRGQTIVWYEFPKDKKQILKKINKLSHMGKVNKWLYDFCIDDNIDIDLEIYSNPLFKIFSNKKNDTFPYTNKIQDIMYDNFNMNQSQFNMKYHNVNKSLLYLYILHFIIKYQRENDNNGYN